MDKVGCGKVGEEDEAGIKVDLSHQEAEKQAG